MVSSEDREYLLGTHQAELERLGLQHRLWAPQTVALWERAAFAPGMTLLDLGSGPGYASVELAQLAGRNGGVIAVDLSQRFLQHVDSLVPVPGAAAIRTLQNDAHSLDLADASVDGAWARWVLCFTADPGAVAAEVARVLRPGARLAVLDYVNYRAFTVAPRSPAIERVIDATDASFRAHGGSGTVGMELPRLLDQAGFGAIDIEPVVRVARPGAPLWQWPTTFFRGYTPALVAMGLLTEDEAAAFHAAWDAMSQNPHAFFLTPPLIGIVAARR
jgi:SAM-dependent methyltransferase